MKIWIARAVAGVVNIILFFGALNMNYFAGSSLSELVGTFNLHRTLGLAGDLSGILLMVMWLALLALLLLPFICAVLWLVFVLPRGVAFVFQVIYVFLALAGYFVLWFVSTRTGDILSMFEMPNFGQAGISLQGGYNTFLLVFLVIALAAGVVALSFRLDGAVVACENGLHKGERIKLERGDSLEFGRNVSTCDVVFPAESVHVSREHCTLTLLPGGRNFLLECHSSNGMLVDGAQMGKGQAVLVKYGSVISFGGETFRLLRARPTVLQWIKGLLGGSGSNSRGNRRVSA